MAKKKTTPKRKKSNSQKGKSKENSFNSIFLKIFIPISILLFLLSIFLLVPSIKRPLLLSIVNSKYVKPNDWATKRVEKAFNLQNSIRENPANEALLKEMLTDYVIWFNSSDRAKPRPKDKINTSSSYEKFHFTTPPLYDDTPDPDNHNYQLRFTGVYIYRNPSYHKKLIEVESYLVEIINKKIFRVKVLDKEQGKSLEWVNTVYRYPLLFVLMAVIVLVLVGYLFFKIRREEANKILDWALKKL